MNNTRNLMNTLGIEVEKTHNHLKTPEELEEINVRIAEFIDTLELQYVAPEILHDYIIDKMYVSGEFVELFGVYV